MEPPGRPDGKEIVMLNRQARSIRNSALAALVAAAALWLTAPAHAIQDAEKALFGPITVTRGEGVRVSMYAVSDPTMTPTPQEAPWDFVVRFFNARGRLVHERRLQLAPGLIGVVDIAIQDPDQFPPDASGRRTLRAEVVGFNPQPDPPGAYFATLELFGRTHMLIGNPNVVPHTER
jgi:hypothetical protein